MNILTFDIEEWYIEKTFHGGHQNRYEEYDRLLNSILDLLDEREIKATFFCVGKMAEDFPDVVKLIFNRGHEIGCHSDKHIWLTKLNKGEVIEDTKIAVDSLQQCIGEKVVSYRAPAFSIGEDNTWVFEVLYDSGIEIDASIFPAKRDFGGYASFGHKEPVNLIFQEHLIHEFPIATTSILGKEVAYSGGGYFRFFPLGFIKSQMRESNYSMTYFHIGDLIKENNSLMSSVEYENYFKEKGSFLNRYKRYIKGNLGKNGAFIKLMKLLENKDFTNLIQADKSINWKDVPIIKIH